MARKTQLALSTEAWSKIEKIVLEANEGFENGSITNSDVANELIKTTYEKKAEELKEKILIGKSSDGSVEAQFDINKHRIARVCLKTDSPEEKAICEAVNHAFDLADEAWKL